MKDYLAEDNERRDQGIAMANAYHKAGGRMSLASWKDEGGAGPLYLYAEGVDPYVGKLFDEPDLEGVFYFGWTTRKHARKMAKVAGVKLEEW